MKDVKQCSACNIKKVGKNNTKYCTKCSLSIGQFTGRDASREKARLRDNHTCQDCKKKWRKGTRRFDCHHIFGLCGKKSKGYDKACEIELLVTLCHKCHFNRPEHKTKKKKDLKIKFDKKLNSFLLV